MACNIRDNHPHYRQGSASPDCIQAGSYRYLLSNCNFTYHTPKISDFEAELRDVAQKGVLTVETVLSRYPRVLSIYFLELYYVCTHHPTVLSML